MSEDDDGMKSVAYGNMVGLLIEAIKDQQKQIDELKAFSKILVIICGGSTTSIDDIKNGIISLNK